MKRSVITETYQYGLKNTVGPELIPRGAASDSLNWRTVGDRIELNRGKKVIGDATSVVGNSIQGHFFAHKADGTAVHFKKTGTKIQYLNDSDVWTDVITGLTEGAEYVFSEYFSLAGAFVYIGGPDGLYKICTANPGSYTDVYVEDTNYKGKILIDTARMFLWDRDDDKTGLYLSHVDEGNYTEVSGESIGSSGSTNYSGTLAFKAGGSRRTCFGILITDGVETFTDDFNGVLTGDQGGTGTINYMTGEYDVTFNSAAAGAVTADYSWEDSNNGGVTDFRYTTPNRLAGEGDVFRQDQGGDKIYNVLPFDGKYYSIKKSSVYELDLTADDTNATNIVFRTGIGIKSHKSATTTGKGIVFMDTGDPERPRLSLLQYNITGDALEPADLIPDYDFSSFDFSDCAIETWGENYVFTGKQDGETSNNRTFIYNSRLKSLDILDYGVRTLVEDAGILYGGDSISEDVYQLFSGTDDVGFLINNYWEGNDERYETENLKRFSRIVHHGYIGPDQKIEVYVSYDNDEFQLVGTIRGDGDYVDSTDVFSVGSTEIGEAEVGGGSAFSEESITAYRYVHQFKIISPKFYKRKIRYKAVGIGYASVNFEKDRSIKFYKDRLPKKYRVGDVELDGSLSN
jgi:hypothetical protein